MRPAFTLVVAIGLLAATAGCDDRAVVGHEQPDDCSSIPCESVIGLDFPIELGSLGPELTPTWVKPLSFNRNVVSQNNFATGPNGNGWLFSPIQHGLVVDVVDINGTLLGERVIASPSPVGDENLRPQLSPVTTRAGP